jgi:hypothetical protein
VLRGFVASCAFAGWPTTSALRWLSATMEGMVLCPSRDGTTCGLPPFTTATHEYVRSMPMIGPLGAPVSRFTRDRGLLIIGPVEDAGDVMRLVRVADAIPLAAFLEVRRDLTARRRLCDPRWEPLRDLRTRESTACFC